MKRTCNECKAGGITHLNKEYCVLGYRRKMGRKYFGLQFWDIPVEECPKPKTWKAYDLTPKKNKVVHNG